MWTGPHAGVGAKSSRAGERCTSSSLTVRPCRCLLLREARPRPETPRARQQPGSGPPRFCRHHCRHWPPPRQPPRPKPAPAHPPRALVVLGLPGAAALTPPQLLWCHSRAPAAAALRHPPAAGPLRQQAHYPPAAPPRLPPAGPHAAAPAALPQQSVCASPAAALPRRRCRPQRAAALLPRAPPARLQLQPWRRHRQPG